MIIIMMMMSRPHSNEVDTDDSRSNKHTPRRWRHSHGGVPVEATRAAAVAYAFHLGPMSIGHDALDVQHAGQPEGAGYQENGETERDDGHAKHGLPAFPAAHG
mmetsp:Transcript_19462/g.39354  ORF Transcript_19462/g.39354 Transcript_19462/m.39354 type:complete len:103 (+) Transcript_19462:513-821(+)